jgi:hypothetical protein
MVSRTPTPGPTNPVSMVASRFFPRFQEGGGVPVDPLEPARPDLLGVRTSHRDEGRARDLDASVLSDGKMLRTSAEEDPKPLPLIVKIAASGSTPAIVEAPEPVAPVVAEDPSPPDTTPDGEPADTPLAAEGSASPDSGEPSPPESGEGIALERVDDPALAGRPRLSRDGTLIVPRPQNGDPTRYGPDPTYPASYYAPGAAPTSVPKTHEVWPTRTPWRPTLLSRVFQRFRGKTGGANPAAAPATVAASARSKPRDLAERGEGVERVAADRLDKPAQR